MFPDNNGIKFQHTLLAQICDDVVSFKKKLVHLETRLYNTGKKELNECMRWEKNPLHKINTNELIAKMQRRRQVACHVSLYQRMINSGLNFRPTCLFKSIVNYCFWRYLYRALFQAILRTPQTDTSKLNLFQQLYSNLGNLFEKPNFVSTDLVLIWKRLLNGVRFRFFTWKPGKKLRNNLKLFIFAAMEQRNAISAPKDSKIGYVLPRRFDLNFKI